MLDTISGVWIPVAVLGVFGIAGGGLSALLGRSLPTDAKLALAPALGAAVFVCASPLLYVDVRLQVIAIAVIAAGSLLTLVQARAFAAPRADVVRVVALALAALAVLCVPAAIRGGWDASGLTNTDPYLWVSQAKAFLDGPPPEPATDFPDRIAYERIDELRWPVALPFLVGVTAWVGRSDPAAVYSAFGAVLMMLLTLAVYAGARGALLWTRTRSTVAAAITASNAALLYATFNGWQAQLAMTLFGTLAILFLRVALERGRFSREHLLAGLCAAAGVGAYGVVFASFAALLVAVAVGYAAMTRSRRWSDQLVSFAAFGATTVLVGLPAIVQAVRQLPILLDVVDEPWWSRYRHSFPDEALGLTARFGSYQRAPVAWSIIALSLTAILIVWGVREQRRRPRGDVLVTVGLSSVAVVLLLWLLGAASYLSLKIVGYTTPLLILLALGALQVPLGRVRRRLIALAAPLFALAASISILYGSLAKSTEPYAGVAEALEQEAGGVSVRVDDDWPQAWLIYYLRERPVSVRAPSQFIVGMGLEPRRLRRRTEPFVLREGSSGSPLWQREGVVLERTQAKSRPPSTADASSSDPGSRLPDS